MTKRLPYILALLIIAIGITISLMILNKPSEDLAINEEDPEIQLNIVTMFGGTDAAKEAFEKQLADFMLLYPNIHVTNDSMTSIGNEYRISVKTAFTTGNEPDMMFFYTGADAEGIIKADAVMSLSEVREDYPDFATHIRESALESVRENNGEIYAIPITGFYEGLYVNKTLFDTYGLELPVDWASFVTAIEVLNENSITPIASPLAQSYYILEHFILNAAGPKDYYDLLEKDVPSSWIEGLNTLKEIYDLGGFDHNSFDVTVDEAQRSFVNGEAAMILEGSWFTNRVDSSDDEIVIMRMPQLQKNISHESVLIGGYSTGYYISTKTYQSDKQEALMLLYEYLISREAIAAIASANGGVPSCDVTTSSLSPIVLNGHKLMDESDHLVMPIDSRLITEAFSYMVSEGLPYILYNELTAEEVLEEVKRIQHR